jgi:hypothetical protein
MRNVYLDVRLPWPAKIAAGMLTPEKLWSFEIYLTTTWTAPYFDHAYLGFSSIKSNGFFCVFCVSFLLVRTFPNQVLFEFMININLLKFWWNNEKLKFCSKNTAIFQKKILKNQEKAQDF